MAKWNAGMQLIGVAGAVGLMAGPIQAVHDIDLSPPLEQGQETVSSYSSHEAPLGPEPLTELGEGIYDENRRREEQEQAERVGDAVRQDESRPGELDKPPGQEPTSDSDSPANTDQVSADQQTPAPASLGAEQVAAEQKDTVTSGGGAGGVVAEQSKADAPNAQQTTAAPGAGPADIAGSVKPENAGGASSEQPEEGAEAASQTSSGTGATKPDASTSSGPSDSSNDIQPSW